jgi:ACS family hexuronate transporter-like MFS transporter
MMRSAMGRWAACASMMLVSLISYIDRNTLALLSPTILRDTRLSGEQYGWIISAFSIAYMLGNPIWGRLLDRVGVFTGMTLAVLLWSVASASHALAAGFLGFAIVRALLGFGEGATFPGGLRTAVQTLPPDRRARGIALAYSGGSLGAILTPLLVTPVAVRFGWRAAFVLTGLLGAVWVAWWTLGLRRAPGLQAAPSPSPSDDERGGQIRLGDRRLWAFIAAYALGALPLAFVMYAAPIYLHQALGLSQSQLGKLLWIPPLGWEVGYFFWGYLVDRLARGGTRDDVHGAILAALALLGTSLALVPSFTRLTVVMGTLFFAMFLAAGFVIVAISYATRAFSVRQSGLIAGIGAGSWSAVVALTMPVFGRLFDAHDYVTAFRITAALPVAAFVLWAAGAYAFAHPRSEGAK